MNQVHTGCEAVTTGVALQFLFTVLAVKVIFTGRAQVHWISKEQGKKRKMEKKNSAGFSISSYLAKITTNNNSSHINFVTSCNHLALDGHYFWFCKLSKPRPDQSTGQRRIPGMHQVIQFTELFIQYMVLFQLSCHSNTSRLVRETVFQKHNFQEKGGLYL